MLTVARNMTTFRFNFSGEDDSNNQLEGEPFLFLCSLLYYLGQFNNNVALTQQKRKMSFYG